MIPTKNTSHTAEAKKLLTSMFRGRPVIEGLLKAIVDQVQTLENVAWQVIEGRQLDNAIGIQIDKIGGIVGEDREGRDDADYKEAVRLRILINRSNGKVDDILKIALAAARGNPWQFWDYFPAGYVVLFGGTSAALLAFAQAMREAKPNGVNAHVLYTDQPFSDLFSPGHFDGATTTGGNGPDDVISNSIVCPLAHVAL